MIMRMATAAALSLLVAGTAMAQQPAPTAPAIEQTQTPPAAAPAPTPAPVETQAAPAPTEPAATAEATVDPTATQTSLDNCIAAAAELGQSAEGKQFSDEKLEKLDELFTKMETMCDASNFEQAASLAKDILGVIESQ
jgi:hypothetical protein